VRKSKHTEEQVVFVLKQTELGSAAEEVCRKICVDGDMNFDDPKTPTFVSTA
jgi:hypothetical protein